MNSSIFNIVVAGVLVLAWLWALGRPALSKISYLVRRMRSNDGGIDYVRPSLWSLSSGIFQPILRPLRSWQQQSIFARRRQLLIALTVTVIVSAGLAIVLRGPFLVAVAVATIALAAYLNAAVRIGGRLVRWQNYVQQRPQTSTLAVPLASDIGQIGESESVEQDGTEKVEVASDLQKRSVSQEADPTLKVKGSRRRKRSATKNPSRRIVFRRPRTGSSRSSNDRDMVSSDWSHLDQAANDR